MTLTRAKGKGTVTKKAVTVQKKVGRSAATGRLLSPAASSTSAINYYGNNAKARHAAYRRVMAFVEECKKKHACG